MTASFLLPLARRGRTSGWRRSCSAGRSISRARKRSGRKSNCRWRRWFRKRRLLWRTLLAWAKDWWKIDIKSEEEKRQEVELQMAAMVPQASTPLENVTGLGEGLGEKRSAAGVTTVEALADMTPEQLEAIEGIGPKTVEKISLAVNNYFASLEAGATDGEVPAEGVTAEGVTEEAAPEAADVAAGEVGAGEETAAGPEATAEAEAASDENKEEHGPNDGSA